MERQALVSPDRRGRQRMDLLVISYTERPAAGQQASLYMRLNPEEDILVFKILFFMFFSFSF